MRLSDYLEDKKAVLTVCLSGGLLFTVLLYFFGVSAAEIILLWLCYAGIVSASLLCGYARMNGRAKELLAAQNMPDRKYLLAKTVGKPASAQERIYFRLLTTALKSMTEEVSVARRQKEEYREFIEQWIHEIKVPITGIQLICENSKSDVTRKIMAQAERIERDVEQALFYARMGSVEKDYLIKETALYDCVLNVLAQNKQYLIQNGVRVQTRDVSHSVYSDEKWLCFILGQIVSNSVKYRGDRPPVIEMASEETEGRVILSVTDNGVGIRPSEVGRVFDKGFVGTNGRAEANSTGIGLYLCGQLCERLGIEIRLDSRQNRYTSVSLSFPKGNNL